MAMATKAAPAPAASSGDDGSGGALITHAAPDGSTIVRQGNEFNLSFFSPPEENDDDAGVGNDDQQPNLEADDGTGEEGQNDLPDGDVPADPSPAPGITGEQLQALLQGNTQLAETLRAFVASQNQPKPAEPVKSNEQKIYVTPEAIPAPMQALMNSEDPAERNRGFAAFGNALVTAVLQQVERDVTERYQPDFTKAYEEHFQQRLSAWQWEQSFNTDYPGLLANDKGRLAVQMATLQAAQMLAQNGVPQQQIVWGNPKYREAFNNYLQSIGYAGGVVKPKGVASNQQQNQQQQRAAPMGRRTGARPAAPGGGQSQQDQMMAVLNTVANGRR